MAEVEIIMPKMGESVMEATILTWLKKEGESIDPDESLLEVATDKVDTEIPSTHGGIVKKILAKEGDVVQVGSPIALITTEVEEAIAPSSDEGVPAKAESNGKDKIPVMQEEESVIETASGMLSGTSTLWTPRTACPQRPFCPAPVWGCRDACPRPASRAHPSRHHRPGYR